MYLLGFIVKRFGHLGVVVKGYINKCRLIDWRTWLRWYLVQQYSSNYGGLPRETLLPWEGRQLSWRPALRHLGLAIQILCLYSAIDEFPHIGKKKHWHSIFQISVFTNYHISASIPAVAIHRWRRCTPATRFLRSHPNSGAAYDWLYLQAATWVDFFWFWLFKFVQANKGNSRRLWWQRCGCWFHCGWKQLLAQ